MNQPKSAGSVVGTLIYLLIGPLAWALHLTAIYSTTTLVCARGAPAGASIAATTSLAIAAATAAAFVVVALPALKPGIARGLLRVRATSPDTESFLDRAMRLLAILSLAAIAWAGASVLIVTPCGQLR